jgi:hypothetical protein
MLPGQKKQREIKSIFGKIPAFLNYSINFCFNVEALSARSRRLPSSTPLQKPTHIGLDSRLLNPALRVSDFKDVLGPYRHAEDLAQYAEGLRQAGLPE